MKVQVQAGTYATIENCEICVDVLTQFSMGATSLYSEIA